MDLQTSGRPTILAADDDAVTRRAMARVIESCGWRPLIVETGDEAFTALSAPGAPRLAILDWIMPGLTGIEVCRRVRQLQRDVRPYLIMATVRDQTSEVISALDAGADDYMIKPIDPHELQARVRVGLRMVHLQHMLVSRVDDLSQALSQVNKLQGLLPICAFCKSIRDDRNYWRSVEEYLSTHADVTFSHAFCPKCVKEHFEPELEARTKNG